MSTGFEDSRRGYPPRLLAVLERLDGLVDWERRDRTGRSGPRMRQSIAPARDLLERLGAPDRGLAVVHVAGSKGKGSVASLVATGLRRWGAREGVYASPHVERIHERIRIGGAEVSDEALVRSLERALDAREDALREGTAGEPPSWFDVLTAAALDAFAAAGLEWLVLECGLGGRLDSTNAVSSRVAVITSVDLEHTAVLGSTRAAIAREKAGILEEGGWLVTSVGPDGDEAMRAIRSVADGKGVRVRSVLPGEADSIEERNRCLAAGVLDLLGSEGLAGGQDGRGALSGALLDPDAVAEARLPGRLERFEVEGLPVVLDGAHVPRSLDLALRDLERVLAPRSRPTVVLGTAREKDAAGLLKVLAGRVDRVVCTSLGTGPVRTPEELRDEALRAGHSAAAVHVPWRAIEMALESARRDGWVLVTGSLHLIGEVRGRIARAAEAPRC